MTIIINGTTGISGVDGSASVPALKGNDADTGIFYPTANEVAASAGAAIVWNASSTFAFKNRIINGDMTIDQRNAGASVTPTSGQFSVDRWACYLTQASKFTIQRSTTAPEGFTNSLLITSSSAYSVTSSDFFLLNQAIEGFNIADLGWGTANAQPVTLSFRVRSSLTGTFGGSLTNSANNRSYPFTYTISSANTYETKTITIAGDTSGTWLTDNGAGIKVWFGLGVGSTNSGTAGAWAGSAFYSATGATSVVGTNGATFYITGVQLEKGSTATSFDYLPYTTELLLCQRYYYQSSGGSIAMVGQTYSQNSVDGLYMPYPFPAVMRTAPTSTILGGTNGGSPANIQMYESYPTNVVINLRSTGGTTSVFWVGATLRSTAEL